VSDLNHKPDPLQRAADALRDAPVPPGPTEPLLATTLAALRARPPRRRWHRYARVAAVAAMLLAAVAAALLWPTPPSAASPFRRGMESAARAKTMTARVIVGQGPGATVYRLYVRGQVNRIEVPNTGWQGAPPRDQVPVVAATVNDLEAKLTLAINFAERTYSTRGLSFHGHGPDIIGQLRRVRDDAVRALGDEVIRGRPTRVYAVRLDGMIGADPRSDVKVWLDAATDLPVRLRADDPPGPWARTTVYDDFAWDRPLAAELFRTTPPAGFRKVDFPMPVPRPPKKD
jgi:hypothetical protein